MTVTATSVKPPAPHPVNKTETKTVSTISTIVACLLLLGLVVCTLHIKATVAHASAQMETFGKLVNLRQQFNELNDSYEAMRAIALLEWYVICVGGWFLLAPILLRRAGFDNTGIRAHSFADKVNTYTTKHGLSWFIADDINQLEHAGKVGPKILSRILFGMIFALCTTYNTMPLAIKYFIAKWFSVQ